VIKINAKTKSQRVLIVIVMIAIFSAVMYLIVSSDTNYIDSLNSRTEADYVTETFVIDEIWEREITGKFAYIFFKLKNEDFNLGLGANDLMVNKDKSSEVKHYLDVFSKGDTIKVKVFRDDIIEARKNNLWLFIKRFFANDNREVEVYRLEKRGKVLSEQDIHFSFKLGKSGGDLSASRIRLFIVGFVVIMIVFFQIRNKIREHRQSKIK
jgi:hypothetical protein